MSYLLDTNVISELRKRHPDPHVLAWYEGVASADLFISVLTVGEIRLGIQRLRRKDTVQADVLERWLRGLRAAYGDHIVDVDVGIAEHWGRLNVPDPLPVIDGLLATAVLAGLILTAAAGRFAAAPIMETDGINLGHKATADDVAAHFKRIADVGTAKHYSQGGEQNAKFFARVQDAPLVG